LKEDLEARQQRHKQSRFGVSAESFELLRQFSSKLNGYGPAMKTLDHGTRTVRRQVNSAGASRSCVAMQQRFATPTTPLPGGKSAY
jgi:hypothetical protein